MLVALLDYILVFQFTVSCKLNYSSFPTVYSQLQVSVDVNHSSLSHNPQIN